MSILVHRLLVVFLSGLAGAIAVGLLAPNAAALLLGLVALGLGMILAILFYLLRPVPDAGLNPSEWPPLGVSLPLPSRPARASAEIIPIAGWRKN